MMNIRHGIAHIFYILLLTALWISFSVGLLFVFIGGYDLVRQKNGSLGWQEIVAGFGIVIFSLFLIFFSRAIFKAVMEGATE